MNKEDKIDLLLDVIKRYDHYIGTTNFKVALLLSFLVTVIIGLSIRVILTATTPSLSTIHIASSVSVVFTVISAIITVIHLLRVVFPNTKGGSNGDSLIFFGDVASLKSSNDYYNKIVKVDENTLLNDISTQTYILADIVNEKFRVLKIAINIIICAVIPLLALSIFLLILESVIK